MEQDGVLTDLGRGGVKFATTVGRFRLRSPKGLFSILAALVLAGSSILTSAPLAPVAAVSPIGGNALVLINSASSSGADYPTYIKPYLDQFGIPYSELDIASHPLPVDLSGYALIIIGQRALDPGGTLLSAAEQDAIAGAVGAGAGLVNFDNDLFAGSVPRYSFINAIFGFGHGGPTVASDVTIGAVPHYITSLHTSDQVISTAAPMTLAAITAPAGVNVIATAGGAPFLATTTYGSGNAVQFASYNWMSYSVLGPLRGLDDLVWRSVVWAARKPFVMRGMPPFVTMRVDDVSDPLTWIPAANAAGFVPWAGVFTNDINPTEAVGLSALAAAGKVTVGLHAFGTSDFFYFDHNSGTNFSDATMAANYAAGSAWFAANNIPISRYLVPHYYEIGSNAFAGLSSWGVSCVGTQMDPGSLEASASWMSAGPFRATQAGSAYDRNANPYYSDFMSVPGHPAYNVQFFNLMTEIRDITGYEWQPSSDVANSVATGTEWLSRPIDGMEMATLFTHEYILANNGVSAATWSATMAGIAANLTSRHPIYVSMDQACAYARALSTSSLASASYDPGSNVVRASFTGSAPVATKFYVFASTGGGAISQTLVNAPSFSVGTTVNYTLPGTIDHIAITPNPASVAAGATLAFSAEGFDAANNPIPSLTYAWSVAAGGGTIDGSGRFTAGSATGNFPDTVVATSGGINAKVSLSVTTPVFDHFSFAMIGGPKFVNSPFTISVSARDAGGNLVPGYVGTAALSVSSGTVSPTTISFTGGVASGPISLPATGTGLTLSVSDSGKVGTSNSFDVVASLACPCSIWPEGTVPANPSVTDNNQPINLGVKFRATIDGYVTGLRFYKGAANTGTHTGYLWTASGTQLAQVTFSGESASGWQTAYFPTSVAVSADTTYVVSYYSPSGYFADTNSGLSSSVSSPPLRALSDGEDGPNAVYLYGAAGFPTSNYQGSNYWTDVVFDTSVGPDTTPPTVISTTPAAGASGVSVSASISATFSEPLAAASVSGSTFVLRDAANNPVSAGVGYNATSHSATLTVAANLAYSATYTATVLGGASGVTDLAGNPLAVDRSWSFTTGAVPPPPANQGPGGPILIVTMAGDPYGRYYTEILRTEGLNEFLAVDISTVNAGVLANYRDVILAPMSLSTAQITMFSAYVNAGGNLVAMRPDAGLASLLGLSSATGTLSNGYLAVDTSKAPGAGLVAGTIQFHGTADNYTTAGATSVAALYTDASSATTNPAVTMRSVGSAGGHAGAFTFDLARSVVLTRQGNPAQAGQYLDGATDLSRADNMFQAGWLDMNKVQIPQADEQQRLLVNMLAAMNAGGAPQPRFWYFPHGYRAVVIMTGDDHGSGGTSGRFDIYLADSSADCSVSDWTCIRSTSYLEGSSLTDPQAAAYVAQGFEVGAHITTNCADWTPAQLATYYTDQLATWRTWFPSLPAPVSNRTHCIAWSDYATQPAVELANGIRLDANYYYWPASWVADRPGLFTGSGIPMRFASADGSLIDVYQATTQMTDESGQSYPLNIDTLLNNALGANQYFGAFTANMHTDSADSAGSAAIIASAQARGVPVISAAQMLTWLDGRGGSSFGTQSWTADGSGGEVLSFIVAAGSGANGLQTMLPMTSSAGSLRSITKGGVSLSFTSQVINGINYAFFNTDGGTYLADYSSNPDPLTISGLGASPHADGTATVSWTTDRPADSHVDYGIAVGSLTGNSAQGALVTSHSVTLIGLTANTKYYFRASSTDESTVSATAPIAGDPPADFTTPAAALRDTTLADFAAGSGLCMIGNQLGDGEVSLAPALNDDFGGTSLSSAWSVNNWGSGSAAVAAGQLTVDGVAVVSNAHYSPGSALDFEATFPAATPFVHVGFAGSNTPFNAAPWALFSTGFAGTSLQARVWLGGDFLDYTIPGSYLGIPHHYRIEWMPTAINFLIDGVLVHSEPAVISDTMTVGASDYNTGGTNPTVDWLWVSPYASPCVFTSRVLDAGGVATWSSATFNADLPAGTAIGLEVRTGNSATPDDGTWGLFSSVSNGASLGASGRYLQYRATLSSTDPSVTPVLRDISFAYGVAPDTSAPVISALVALAGGDGSATVSWTTDEPADSSVSYGTAPGSLSGSKSDFGLVLAHSLTLTGLTPNQTYYYRVSSTDASTNRASAPALPNPPASFATPSATLIDTTSADFGAGTPDANITITNAAGGELTLSTPINETFAGSTLPAGWSAKSGPWDSGGVATVSGGILSVDGTMVGTNATYGPGHSLSFVATFAAQKYQHIGFVADLAFNDPWAIISTGSDGDGVYARTSSGAQVSLGSGLLGSAHTYRIDWTASGFAFWVDGAQITTIPFATAGPMLVGASDAVSGTPLILDSLAMGPYAPSGTFLSRVFDATSAANWTTLDAVGDTPAGTDAVFATRSGNTAIADGTWSAWAALGPSQAIASPSARYIQYRVTLSSSDPSLGPTIYSVSLGNELLSLPVITWPTPAPITYGTTLGVGQLNASANMPGSFAYDPPAGTVLAAGGAQALSVTFNPTDPSAAPLSTTIYIVVVPDPLVVSINNLSRAYGAANPPFTYTIGGFVHGDTSAVVSGVPDLSSSADASSPVGTYQIDGERGSLSAANYYFTYSYGTLTINPAVLTIRAANATRPYGAPDPTFDYTIGGFVNGQTESSSDLSGSPLCVSSVGMASPLGLHSGAISCTIGSLSSHNYSFGSPTAGDLDITKGALTVHAINQSKTYGDADTLGTTAFFVSGLVGTDSVATVTLTSSGTGAPAPSGTYPIIASDASGSGLANYDISYETGTLTVNQAILTVSAPSAGRLYGADNPAFVPALTGFVNGENAAVLLVGPACSSTASASSPVGSYPITCSGAVAANYSFFYIAGILIISPITLDHLVLSPANASIAVDTSQIYSAIGFDAYGNNLGDVSAVTVFTIDGNLCAGRSCTSSVAGDHVIVGADGSAQGSTTLHFTGMSGTTYHPLTPVRLVDSRLAYGLTRLRSGVPQTFAVVGHVGVPIGALAITGNVVSVGSTAGGYFALTTTPTATPGTSTLNFPKGDTRANNVTMTLSATGTISVVYKAISGASANLVFDVTGYFTNDPSGSTYHSLSSVRLVDSRLAYGLTRMRSGVPQTFAVVGHVGVPANAVAISGDVVSVSPTAGGYFALTTTPTATPSISTLNFPKGDTRANGVIMALGPGGTISVVYQAISGASADLVFDVTGYFTADLSGTAYHPLAPVRLADSRLNYGLTRLRNRVPQIVAVAGALGVPSSAFAIIANVTSLGSTAGGYFALTTTPTTSPDTSTLNFPRGDTRANGVTTTLLEGEFALVYVSSPGSSADVVIDIDGFFLAADGG